MKKLIATIIVAYGCLSLPAFAGAVDEMLDTDRAFAAMAQSEGAPAAFAAYAAEDVRMFPDGGAAYKGRDAMIERFAGWPDGASLAWTPVEGVAGAAGDFGFTWGNYVFRAANKDGEEVVEHGKYVSIWRRESDGSWKFVADIGNESPEPHGEN